MDLGVQGLGLRVQGFRLKVCGSGFRVECVGLGFKVYHQGVDIVWGPRR